MLKLQGSIVFLLQVSTEMPRSHWCRCFLWSFDRLAAFKNCLWVFFLSSFTRQLFAPGYQEIWYTADGARQASSPGSAVSLYQCFQMEGVVSRRWSYVWIVVSGCTSSLPACWGCCLSVVQGNCLYHGEVWGVDGSSVAVSTCSGLRYVKTTTNTIHDSSTNGFVY